MKKMSVALLVLLFALVLTTSSVLAQTPTPPPTELQPGDIAIIGFNFFNNGEFTFVTLRDIPEGMIIRFTDKGWTNGPRFVDKTNDGIFDYYAPPNLLKGMVIKVVLPLGQDMMLSTNGDQIFAYLGPGLNVDKILFGLNSDNLTWAGSCTTSNNSALPNILDPKFSISIPEKDGGYYNGPHTFTDTDSFYSALANLQNWVTGDLRYDLPTDSFSFDPTVLQIEKFQVVNNYLPTILFFGFTFLIIITLLFVFTPTNKHNKSQPNI